MRIGVDVGGTNTDAVAMDGKQVVAAAKTPTTPDIESGVSNAISELLTSGDVDPRNLDAVIIGTTHFINAFVQRKGLAPIGVIRLALPACTSIPAMADWPPEVRTLLSDHVYVVEGGNNFDGRPISELDVTAVTAAARSMNQSGIRSVAVTGVFSPATPDMELRTAEILKKEMLGVQVTLSHQVGSLGLIERENAAIINATLRDLSNHVVGGLEDALAALGVEAPMFLSQNDGTLMNPSLSRSYPIRTFASGATNSMRGAYFLSGEADAIVADIGGTTTDVGALVKGYPRETSTTVNIGGVCTNFRMPDAISIGLGGGSIVSPASNEEIVVGPESVGYQILDKALVFGGETLTATDIAVAAGYEGLGDPSLVGHLDGGMVERCTTRFRTMLSNSVDQMKIGTGDVPLVLVGGGSILISDTIEGTTKTIIPDYADVANAVGAAISQVGVQVEKLVSYDHQNRDDTVAKAMQDVQRMALDAGGDKSSVAVVEVEEVQLAYMPGSCVRLRIRAVADLCTEGIPELHAIGAG